MNQIKQEIASIAAKFVVENGFSYYDAKTKAQELIFLRTGQKIKKKYLPNNIELDQAIKKHLMLFFKKEHLERLTELRKKAKDLMEIIKIFNPILIGSIANETVTRFSDIRVCCFTETTKEIAIALLNKGINSDACQLKHPLGKGLVEGLNFIWNNEKINIYALIHIESKTRLRGLKLQDVDKLLF